MTKLRSNVIANYLGQGWRAIMSLAFIPLYIEYLGMESYGLIGVFGVMNAWLALLDMGMSPTLNREMARYTAGAHTPQSINDLLRSIEIICFSLALLIGLIVWFASGFLASDWLKVEKLPISVVAQAISYMAFVAALRFIEGIYRGSLYGLQQQVWYNAASAGLETLRHGGVVLVIIFVSRDIQTFFLWQALISLLTNIVFGWRVHHALPSPPSPARFSRKEVTEVWQFAGGMLGIAVLSLLLTQVDKVILSNILSLKAFGYYMLAATVVGSLYMASGPLTMAIYPRMVELVTQEKHEQLITLYHQSAQGITVLIAPGALLLSFFGGGVVYMWSGNVQLAQYAAPIISILVIGTFLNTLMGIPYLCQLAYGWTSLTIRVNVVTVATLIPLLFWLAPRYGAIGAAWIWLAVNIGYVLIDIQLMHLKIFPREKWRWYLLDVIVPVSGTFGVMWLAQWLQPTGYHNRLHWFLFLLITGVSAMLTSALLATHIRTRLFGILARFLNIERRT